MRNNCIWIVAVNMHQDHRVDAARDGENFVHYAIIIP
jgi:hypothetical protein